MLDSKAAADAADALAITIVTLFEEGLEARLRSAGTLVEFAQGARRLRELAEDAILLTASLRTLVLRDDHDSGEM